MRENHIIDLIDLLKYDRDLLLTEDPNGWTPLHEAARHGNPLMVYFLIDNGADPLTKTTAGNTALSILHSFRPKEMVDDSHYIVKGYKLSQTILEKAEKGKKINGDIIDKEEIGQSNEIVVKMKGLANALVYYELQHELEELYHLNPDIIDETDEHGWTPLHEAARNGNIGIIRFLLEQGSDIFKMTASGKTVLSVAEMHAKTADIKTHEVMNLLKPNII